MTLTSIVALLQAALMLLTLAQSSPNLPQSMRDNATQVARQAIQEATAALTSQSYTPSPGNNAVLPPPTGGNSPGIYATIDQSSLYVNSAQSNTQITVTGSASNVNALTLSLKGFYGGSTAVVNGRWSVTLQDALPAGSYFLQVTNNDGGAVLTNGTLTIHPVGTPSLTVLSASGVTVSVSYANMPPASIKVVNQSTGVAVWTQELNANAARSGTLSFTINSAVPAGTYTLQAYDYSGGIIYATSAAVYLSGTQVVANPVINFFYASQTTVLPGNSTTLSWSASNTAQCGISVISGNAPGLNLAQSTSNSSGATSVSTGPLSQTATYELRCAPLTGASGGYAIQDVTVNVGSIQTNPVVINSFTASPTWVTPGQGVTFSWSSNLTNSDISYYGGGCGIQGVTPNNQSLYITSPNTGSGSFTYVPSGAATYTLTCSSGGKDGSPMATKQLTVVVSYAAALPQCPANSAQQRGQVGQTIACSCQPGFALGTIQGGGFPGGYYSDNSDICTAAAQSGQLNNTYGGEVDYKITPAQSSYPGWTANGITSQPGTDNWPGSFQIVGPKG